MQVDVDRLIDERPISALQIRVFILCAAVTVLDAIDSQSIGVAGPLIAQGLKIAPADFWPAYSAGLFGAAIGAFAFGPISDRFGRKPTLVFTTLLFGIFTCLTVFAGSFPELVAFRLAAGLGLGGATPCFITMAAEYAPHRSRAMLVSLLWAGYPLGNAIGGFMTSYVVKHFHWSMVFYVGGIPTLFVALLLLLFMPESLRFLAARGSGERATHLARRLDPDLPEAMTIAARTFAAPKAPLRDLFANGRAAGTILLGLMLYFGFWTTTVIVLQTPTIFREAGMALSASAFLVAVYSLVATCGMAIAGWLLNRFGPVLGIALPFAGGAVVLAALGLVADTPIAAGAIMMMLGLTVSVASSGVIALAAISYPTAMRSAGTGWVLAMGRFGQVCSPYAVSKMLGLGFSPGPILAVMALAPLLGGLCVLLKSALAGGPSPARGDAVVEAEKTA
ncbi:MAG TPA: MFS transporter [Micropepsaceae bacterium]|jgi:AAHS family 4-hydroxybenzoate transporter-like MFS transporter